MNNFTIVPGGYGKGDDIIIAKKLKTRRTDFDFIASAAVQKEEVVVNEVEETTPEVEVKIEPVQNEVSEEREVEDFKFSYGVHKEEDEIDYDKIRDIADTYRGINPNKSVEKAKVFEAEKEEVKAEELTKEEYEKALYEENSSARIISYKNNIKSGYQVHLDNIKRIKEMIEQLTGEYAKETEIGNRLEDIKKENKNVLNGINAWNMDFFEERREDEATRSLISHIEEYFEINRRALDKVIQEIQNNGDRKSSISVSEKRAREDQVAFKKALQKYMDETYPELKKANEKDLLLKKANEDIAELTGETEEKVVFNGANNISNFNSAYEHPVMQEPVTERVRVTDTYNLSELNAENGLGRVA